MKLNFKQKYDFAITSLDEETNPWWKTFKKTTNEM